MRFDRILSAALVAALLTACGGSGSGSLAPHASAGTTSRAPTDVAGQSVFVTPSTLTFSSPTAPGQTFTATTIFSGDVSAVSSNQVVCTVNPPVATGLVDPTTGGQKSAVFTVLARSAGSCSIAASDKKGNTAVVAVTVKAVTTRLYVTSQTANTLQAYNATDGSPIAPAVTAGLNGPAGVAVDAAGKIYVANEYANTVTTYNPDGSQTIPTITAGLNHPWGLAVDANGKIYVGNRYSFTVTTYDASGNQISPTISTLNDPRGIAVDSTGNIFVSDFYYSTIQTFDLNGNRIAPTITGGGLNAPEQLALDASGKLYLANSAIGVTTFNSSNGSYTTPTIADQPGATGVAVDLSGKIYVAYRDPGYYIGAYNSDGSASTPKIPLGDVGDHQIAVH